MKIEVVCDEILMKVNLITVSFALVEYEDDEDKDYLQNEVSFFSDFELSYSPDEWEALNPKWELGKTYYLMCETAPII